MTDKISFHHKFAGPSDWAHVCRAFALQTAPPRTIMKIPSGGSADCCCCGITAPPRMWGRNMTFAHITFLMRLCIVTVMAFAMPLYTGRTQWL
jgi:hypothetical protein